MRIGMVTSEFPPISGGQGYHAYNLSQNLVRRGYKITVLTRGSWGKTNCEQVDGVTVYRVRFIPSYPFHLQLHGFFLNRLFRSIESQLDLVHFHSPIIPLVHTSLPTIVTEHGTSKGFVDHLEILDIFSFMAKMFSRMYTSIDRKVISSADNVIAISESCAEELQAYYGVQSVKVVNNGVNSNLFTPGKKENQTSYVLYVGSLITGKGLPDLIKSAICIRREYPHVRFILVGKGPLERYLKGLVHRLNLDANFTFIGYMNQHRLVEIYQNAAVFVLPSYHEGLPTVLLEAMSCGIPTVATNVAGNSEIVIDGETGFLVAPKSPRELAQAILNLLSEEGLRKQMGANGRKQVEKYYDWEIITDKIEEIYNRSINTSFNGCSL